jgi:hypothetical protein
MKDLVQVAARFTTNIGLMLVLTAIFVLIFSPGAATDFNNPARLAVAGILSIGAGQWLIRRLR